MKKTETETSSSSSLAWIKLSYNEGNTKLASTVLIEKKDIKIILKSNYDSSKSTNDSPMSSSTDSSKSNDDSVMSNNDSSKSNAKSSKSDNDSSIYEFGIEPIVNPLRSTNHILFRNGFLPGTGWSSTPLKLPTRPRVSLSIKGNYKILNKGSYIGLRRDENKVQSPKSIQMDCPSSNPSR